MDTSRRVSLKRNKLIEDNRSLVAAIARRYTGVAELDELIGYGNVALVEAVDAYDRKRGKFASFAWNRIKGAMIRGTTQQHRAVRLPEYQENRIRTIEASRERLTQEYGRPPTDDEIAAATGLDVTKVRESDGANELTRAVEPDEEEMPVWVSESPGKTAQILRVEERERRAYAALSRLDARDKKRIPRDAFTMRHRDGYHYEEIAERLTVSVRDVENAIERARTTLPNDPDVQAEKYRTPPIPAQRPKPRRALPRKKRPRAPVVRYALTEAERDDLQARAGAKYRPTRPVDTFDIEAWRAGAEERRRERIAQAWRDVAELDRLSKVRRHLCFSPAFSRRDVLEEFRFIRLSKRCGEPVGRVRPRRETVEEHRAYAMRLEKSFKKGAPSPGMGELSCNHIDRSGVWLAVGRGSLSFFKRAHP
jgi:RNA polymerase sigma factor (sigma-70 family)